MRIDWRAQATYSVYSMTQEHKGLTEIVDLGICREFKEDRPLAAPRAADIKVVVAEVCNIGVSEIPAVVTVNGPINEGAHLNFESVVDSIKNATVYFESSGGDIRADIRIGEIIHRKGFHTAGHSRADARS